MLTEYERPVRAVWHDDHYIRTMSLLACGPEWCVRWGYCLAPTEAAGVCRERMIRR